MPLLCYEELLKHESETYKEHVRWLKRYRPEEVPDSFEAELEAARGATASERGGEKDRRRRQRKPSGGAGSEGAA
jgi:hypothetical protein